MAQIVNTLHKGDKDGGGGEDEDDDDDDDNVYCPKHRSPVYINHELYQFCMAVKRKEHEQYVRTDLQT